MEHELDGAADMTAVQPVAVEPARNSVVETKVAAQSATGITIGLLTWALTYFIPAWHSGIPGPLLPFIPVAAAWLTGTGAGWLARHTHRPDLTMLTVAPAAPAVAEIPVTPELVTAPARLPEQDAGLAIISPLRETEERLTRPPGLPAPPDTTG